MTRFDKDQSDGTSQFNADATFCAVPGVSGSGTSLRAYADPTSFLRHYNGDLYTASNGGADPWDTTTSWADDATWTPTPSWSS